MGTLVGQGRCLTCPIRPQSLFGCLEEQELKLIEDFQTRIIKFETGDTIYTEGERLGLIYTLRAGHVKLTKFNSEGNAQIVRLVKPGDLFGYEKLIADASYMHTAEALEEIELCQLSVDNLNKLRGESSAVNQAITERALMQVMRTEEHLTQVGLLKSKARLAWFLLDWVGNTAEPVAMPLSRRELGQYLGLTVETISRHFAEWKRQGIVAEKQGTLQILERDTLNDVVTSE